MFDSENKNFAFSPKHFHATSFLEKVYVQKVQFSSLWVGQFVQIFSEESGKIPSCALISWAEPGETESLPRATV